MRGVWSGIRGSNSRPSAWEANALPTELIPHGMTKVWKVSEKSKARERMIKICKQMFAFR